MPDYENRDIDSRLIDYSWLYKSVEDEQRLKQIKQIEEINRINKLTNRTGD